jgi:hypothetical protein
VNERYEVPSADEWTWTLHRNGYHGSVAISAVYRFDVHVAPTTAGYRLSGSVWFEGIDLLNDAAREQMEFSHEVQMEQVTPATVVEEVRRGSGVHDAINGTRTVLARLLQDLT